MFHIIYKTTNTVNDKIYIGYHFQESDPYQFDGYLGSGVLLLKAIQKYGSDKFTRETLYVFDTDTIALEKEAAIVTESFIKRPDVYNVTIGGGKPPSQKGIPKSDSHKQKIGESQKGKVLPPSQKDNIAKSLTGRKHEPRSEKWRQNISSSLMGKSHTEIRKQHMRENHADVSGSNNPMFGKTGKNNPNFGRKNSPESIQRLTDASNASQITITCPHCNLSGKRAGMQRWHFDNCRDLKK